MTSALLCRQRGQVSTDSTPPRVQELERKSVSDYRFPNSGSYNRDTSEGPMKRSLIAGLMLVVFGVSGNIARAQGGSGCDRECLRGFVTQYLNAMVAHNPAALTTAPSVRFTEDTQTLKLGEGLWKNANAIRPYRMDFIDVRESTTVSHVIVEEGGMPVMLSLRLKIADRKISEVETMVTRSREQGAIFTINALQTPRPAMSNPVDPSKRDSRAELIRISEFYPAGLRVGGSFEAVSAPFAPDAYRIENGSVMAGPGARAGSENIKTQRIIAHPDITYNVQAVDEELGVAVLRMDFGDTGNYGAGNALVVVEAFKIYGGQIHAVEAFMRVMKSGSPSGWNYDMKKSR